jgi:hypothetical protein
VPTLIIHGDDDQIVPIDASAHVSAILIKNATLKIYLDGHQGLADTHKDELNAYLLAYVKAIKRLLVHLLELHYCEIWGGGLVFFTRHEIRHSSEQM